MDAASALELLKWAGDKAIKATPPAVGAVTDFAKSVLFGSIGTQIARGIDRGMSAVATEAACAIRALPEAVLEVAAEDEYDDCFQVQTTMGPMTKGMAKDCGLDYWGLG